MFVTLEGIESDLNRKVADSLCSKLKESDIEHIYVTELETTDVGHAIGDILKDKKQYKVNSEAELLLFLAARAQTLNDVIKPALKRGDLVILNRYVDATMAYQGMTVGISKICKKFIDSFCIEPDITFLIDVNPSMSYIAKAINEVFGKVHTTKPLEFYEAVREKYLKLAKKYRGRIVIIDGEAPAESQVSIMYEYCHVLSS